MADGNTVYCLAKNFQFGFTDYVMPEMPGVSTDRYINMNDNRQYKGDAWHLPGAIPLYSKTGQQISVIQHRAECGE